jgi:quercetin 2,3-dioxygenase
MKTTASEPTIVVQRAGQRFHTSLGWLDSRHNFNFGHHFHPDNDGFGMLLVNNDDVVAPGGGFGEHGHRDMEIVTWVLSGRLEHRDSEGNRGVSYPGLAQRMSAGRGIRHSEMNASDSQPVHFVQMWVPPHENGIAPGYEQLDINAQLDGGRLAPIASGQGHSDAITIHQRDAVLWGARLTDGGTVDVPSGAHVHVFIALGSGDLAGVGPLQRGDAARLTNAQTTTFTAGPDGSELLVWVTA